jgi:hypothetical protein
LSRHWFSPPVNVRTPERVGLRLHVNSVEVAAEELLKWDRRGPQWRKAVASCMAALKGKATPEQARKAFEAAAKEAGCCSRVVGQFEPEGNCPIAFRSP